MSMTHFGFFSPLERCILFDLTTSWYNAKLITCIFRHSRLEDDEDETDIKEFASDEDADRQTEVCI